MLRMFYQSVVASATFFGLVCWGSRLRAADANKINKIIRKAGSVLGVQLDSLLVVSVYTASWTTTLTLSIRSSIMTNDMHIGQRAHSVGLHDEINWIIAIVGLCSLSEQG